MQAIDGPLEQVVGRRERAIVKQAHDECRALEILIEGRGREHARRDADVQVNRRRLKRQCSRRQRSAAVMLARIGAPFIRGPGSVVRLAWTPPSLAAFRILFGLLMAASTLRFMALGWVDEFLRPAGVSLHVGRRFRGCSRCRRRLMHLHFAALVVLALAVAARRSTIALSTALFFAGFTYVELIDKTTYLNHYYLVSLP